MNAEIRPMEFQGLSARVSSRPKRRTHTHVDTSTGLQRLQPSTSIFRFEGWPMPIQSLAWGVLHHQLNFQFSLKR